MKIWLLILIIFISGSYAVHAQSDSTIQKKIYRTWVKPIKNYHSYSGILMGVGDSSILVSPKVKKDALFKGNFEVRKVSAEHIQTIQLQKKGQKGIGILVGASSGLVTGIAIDILMNKNNDFGDRDLNKAVGAIVFISVATINVATGAGIGALIDRLSRKQIKIKGSQELFDASKAQLTYHAVNYLSGGTVWPKSFFKQLPDTLVDSDGNVYGLLALGGQVWMAENLKTTHYRDGSKITDVYVDLQGGGHQYSWSAVTDNRQICPAGWHVPTLKEWTCLFASPVIASSLTGKQESGFTVGNRICQWWSSTEQDSLIAQSLYLNNETAGIMFNSTAKNYRLSIRCIRN